MATLLAQGVVFTAGYGVPVHYPLKIPSDHCQRTGLACAPVHFFIAVLLQPIGPANLRRYLESIRLLAQRDTHLKI